MRHTKLDIQELAHITTAISHYEQLCSYFRQLITDNKETLQNFFEELLTKYKKTWIDNEIYNDWCRIDIHVVNQNWPSTACGWGGMGGAAFTDSYTTIIENSQIDLVAVYYSGKLAYLAKNNELMNTFKAFGYKHMPGITHAKDSLDIIYINKK